jgi:monoamine oxidase
MEHEFKLDTTDLARTLLVSYAGIAAAIINEWTRLISTKSTAVVPSSLSSDGPSIKSRWAKRLVRQTLSEEINQLRKRGVTSHTLSLGSNSSVTTPGTLPRDPTFDRKNDTSLSSNNSSDDSSCGRMGTTSTTTSCHGITEFGMPPRRVCIVGAGIAGLYIAMILDDLKIPNLEYDILEGSDRIGGRIWTYRFGDDHKHDYYDVGAMRYPDIPTMKRVFDLFRRTKMPLLKYCLQGGDECPKLFNDSRHVSSRRDPYNVGVAGGGTVADDVVDDVNGALDEAFGPYKRALAEDFEAGFDKLMAVDDFSTREYLRRGGPDGTGRRHDFHSIQWMETQNTSTGLFDQAFSESVMDSFDFDHSAGDVDWHCIEGGTGKLIDAMQDSLRRKPETGKRVQKMSIDRKSREEDGNMSVHVAGESEPRGGYSTIFNTTTLACLSRIDTSGLDLHPAQKDAIRSLHYDDSAKVALQFSYPWWIVDCGIRNGGTSSTDLPLRTCIYPSYNLNDGDDQPAILLASYTWAQDAIRFGSMIANTTGRAETSSVQREEELVELILQNLARLHAGKMTYEKLRAAFTGVYHAWSWQNDPFSAGAFALYGPGQFSHLYPYLTRPAADSKFHIVGEAASAQHGWVVGSLNSAYAAVLKFLYRFRLWKHMSLLVERWGEVEELEGGEHGTVHLQVALGMLTRDQMASVRI